MAGARSQGSRECLTASSSIGKAHPLLAQNVVARDMVRGTAWLARAYSAFDGAPHVALLQRPDRKRRADPRLLGGRAGAGRVAAQFRDDARVHDPE